jgi:hypothetical protein
VRGIGMPENVRVEHLLEMLTAELQRCHGPEARVLNLARVPLGGGAPGNVAGRYNVDVDCNTDPTGSYTLKWRYFGSPEQCKVVRLDHYVSVRSPLPPQPAPARQRRWEHGTRPAPQPAADIPVPSPSPVPPPNPAPPPSSTSAATADIPAPSHVAPSRPAPPPSPALEQAVAALSQPRPQADAVVAALARRTTPCSGAGGGSGAGSGSVVVGGADAMEAQPGPTVGFKRALLAAGDDAGDPGGALVVLGAA